MRNIPVLLYVIIAKKIYAMSNQIAGEYNMFWEGTYIGTASITADGDLVLPYHYKRIYPKWMIWKIPRHSGFGDIAYVPVVDGEAQLHQVTTDKYGQRIPDEVLCFLVTMCHLSGLELTL